MKTTRRFTASQQTTVRDLQRIMGKIGHTLESVKKVANEKAA
jgi:hypothetical protein